MWRLYTYDVWGNAEDGWDVNEVLWTSVTENIPIDASDRAIREAFRFDPRVGLEGDEETIYLTSETGKPLGELRWEKE